MIAENASAGAPSEADAAAWEMAYMFGDQAHALLDPVHAGRGVFFPNEPGYHGTAVMTRGSVIYSLWPNDHAGAIQGALDLGYPPG